MEKSGLLITLVDFTHSAVCSLTDCVTCVCVCLLLLRFGTFLTGGVEHDQGMFFLFQGLAKVLRTKMADRRGPVLPGQLWWRGGLWTAQTEENYPYLQL